jgi:NADPH:quinone reductase-like Zn-dependent oxidoreductase
MTLHQGTSTPPAASTPAVMRAVVHDRYGERPEDVLRVTESPVPEPAPGQLLVRVEAASIDRGTWHAMAGLPYPIRLAGFGLRRPKFLNPGRSLAGTVVRVGAEVTGFAVGDAVYGVGESALAEYAVARPAKLAAKPAGLTFQQAAAVPVSGLTALQAVRDHGRLVAGERVLVLGASGGVGSFLVQLAKAAGAQVTAVCSTAKVEAVRALGADTVLDYTREEPAGPFDVVFDVGGNRPLRLLRRLLTAEGRLVIVGGEGGGKLLGGTDRQLRAQFLSPFGTQKLGTFLASENAADLAALGKLLEAGTVRPLLDRTYPLERTADAIRALLDGRALGKIVISPR